MTEYSAFLALSPTRFADVLPRSQLMNTSVRRLWEAVPRVAGPAYTVRCGAGDHLMLHAAVYSAPPGSVIVAEAADHDYALAGGNVARVAQRLGIAGFVFDGAVRDVSEMRDLRFPVFARAVVPKSGGKVGVGSVGEIITCGGVRVAPGDIIVADEEGIAVVPVDEQSEVLAAANKREAAEASMSTDEWERDHRAKVFDLLAKKGITL